VEYRATLKGFIMDKLLVVGSKGMLGVAVSRYFQRKGWSVKELSRAEFDIAHQPADSLLPYLKDVSVVVNCAGVVKPRIAVTPIEDVFKVNSVFPRNLALLSKKIGVKCVHITSDCVYSGRKGHYSEEDLFDAEDVYGLSKCAGENKDCMTIRTSIIGEERGTSRNLLEWARSQKGKPVNGYTNHFWNGVTTVYLAEIIEKIVTGGLYKPGIFHIFSPDTVSKHSLMEIFDEVYDLQFTINTFEAPEPVDRSMTSIYDLSSKVSKVSVREQVVQMREFFKTEN